MNDCVFCKIVRQEVPSYTVYEDDSFLVFLDINPQSPGHLQVIPKKHTRWVWDVENIEEYFAVVKKMAKALQNVFGTEAIWSQVMGDEVSHAHVWVYPNPHEATGKTQAFTENAKLVREALTARS